MRQQFRVSEYLHHHLLAAPSLSVERFSSIFPFTSKEDYDQDMSNSSKPFQERTHAAGLQSGSHPSSNTVLQEKKKKNSERPSSSRFPLLPRRFDSVPKGPQSCSVCVCTAPRYVYLVPHHSLQGAWRYLRSLRHHYLDRGDFDLLYSTSVTEDTSRYGYAGKFTFPNICQRLCREVLRGRLMTTQGVLRY